MKSSPALTFALGAAFACSVFLVGAAAPAQESGSAADEGSIAGLDGDPSSVSARDRFLAYESPVDVQVKVSLCATAATPMLSEGSRNPKVGDYELLRRWLESEMSGGWEPLTEVYLYAETARGLGTTVAVSGSPKLHAPIIFVRRK